MLTFLIVVLILILLLILSIAVGVTNPVFYARSKSAHIPVEPDRLRCDVHSLTHTDRPRHYQNIDILNQCAKYIQTELQQTGGRVEVQRFQVDTRIFKNVICSFGPIHAPRIIVGAHYDVCGEQPGADDNASAVAGMLEIARLIGELKPPLTFRVDCVAYCLEEPPFFKTDFMGSAIHARSLHLEYVHIKVMICLEMIGYFSDQKGSQRFPVPLMDWFYPSKGNFIALVGDLENYRLVRECKKLMNEVTGISVRSINAPVAVQGVDFSDHLNYWKYDYPALMVTDTAFYRNPNYHEPTDTIDTLDFQRMADVVKGVYWYIVRSQ